MQFDPEGAKQPVSRGDDLGNPRKKKVPKEGVLSGDPSSGGGSPAP